MNAYQVMKRVPEENYAFWMTMMCPCRIIDCNKQTILVRDADHGRGCAWVRQGEGQNSVPYTQFCCEPKLVLKK